MNTKQAKAEPLYEFLGRMGHMPASVRGNDLWYVSPFRPEERTPSFKIDRLKNVWYDHGLGVGGSIIDFVQHLNATTDISRVLASIEGILGSVPRPAIALPEVSTLPRTPPVIERVGELQDRMLVDYVLSRGIPLDLARIYFKEVVYRVGGAGYSALGFANDSGGFEVRSPSFKGTLGTKDMSYLAKTGSHQAAVFEGMFDFLSVLAHYQRDSVSSNVLVLNSLSLLERGAARLAADDIQKLHVYFDHDDAGRAGVATLRERGSWDVVDASGLYAGYKDMNEYWV